MRVHPWIHPASIWVRAWFGASCPPFPPGTTGVISYRTSTRHRTRRKPHGVTTCILTTIQDDPNPHHMCYRITAHILITIQDNPHPNPHDPPPRQPTRRRTHLSALQRGDVGRSAEHRCRSDAVLALQKYLQDSSKRSISWVGFIVEITSV